MTTMMVVVVLVVVGVAADHVPSWQIWHMTRLSGCDVGMAGGWEGLL